MRTLNARNSFCDIPRLFPLLARDRLNLPSCRIQNSRGVDSQNSFGLKSSSPIPIRANASTVEPSPCTFRVVGRHCARRYFLLRSWLDRVGDELGRLGQMLRPAIFDYESPEIIEADIIP